jgi:hypothetical protein
MVTIRFKEAPMSDETSPVDYSAISSGTDEPTAPAEISEDVLDVPAADQGFQPLADVPSFDPFVEVPDAEATFVSVNITGGKLNVRGADSADGEVVGTVPNGALLKVISAENPEYPFVEVADGDTIMRGYVKSAFTVAAQPPQSV